MFRRQPQVLVIPGRTCTEYVTSRAEITERRAPTDESVRLLREMEQAADKRRVDAMTLEDNTFHGKVFLEQLAHEHALAARCIFDINGHRMTVDAKQDLFARTDAQSLKMELLKKLRDNMAERIASEILIELSRGIA